MLNLKKSYNHLFLKKKDYLCQKLSSMKNVTSIVLLLAISISSIAQSLSKRYSVSGYIRDSSTTENLIGAVVYNKTDSTGTSTNQYGFYSLILPTGEVELVYSYVGYNMQTCRFHLWRDTVINANFASSVRLQEVLITANNSIHINNFNMPVAQIKSLPAFMGEADVLKSLQLLPGIQSGNEGSNGLHVRGGGPDQNLILLDGVPVYNANHLFGFFSVFNADAINSVEVYKGGFPARYGGRASAVVDITMKEGSVLKYHGEGSIGLLGGRFTFGGPVSRERTSFIVSGRVSPLSYITKPIMGVSDYFYDLTAKINHKFSDKDRIFFSAYLGNDDFSNVSEKNVTGYFESELTQISSKYAHEIKWGNATSVFRWNHIVSGRLFSNVNLSYSKYRLRTGVVQQTEYRKIDSNIIESNLNGGLRNMSGIEDLACRIAIDYIPAVRHHVRFGASSIFHIFQQGASTYGRYGEKTNDSKITAFEHALYAEDDITITRKIKANFGVRWSAFDVQNSFYHSFDPRISLSYQPTQRSTAKTSYSRMTQFTQLLTSSGVGLPTDLWVPSTTLLKPQQADQFSLGYEYRINNVYEWSLEGYYKKMNHALEYKEGTSIYKVETDWEKKVSQGVGHAYGIELLMKKKHGNTTGWLGYTLARSTRKFDNINGGKTFPYKYDRRHEVNFVLNHRLNEKIELTATWVFNTGISATIPLAYYNTYNLLPGYPVESLSSDIVFEYSRRNEYRMSPYHRLDLSLNFFKTTKWGERRWIIGVYNVYARKNPYLIDVRYDDFSEKFNYVEISIFPIIPSISYQFKF